MSRRQELIARTFRALDRIAERPIGRAARAAGRALDPIVYAAWYAVNWARTRTPETFNEKVRYKIVRDRRPILSLMADKVAVREHVARIVGDLHLTQIHQVHATAAEIRWDALPRQFVCKVSHASGGLIIVSDTADPTKPLPEFIPRGHGRLVVHPDAFDAERATEIVQHWLARPYGWAGFKREWAYHDIRPRVLIEEFLEGPDGSVPVDYKFFVFHGRCAYVHVDSDRYGRHRRDVFDREWNQVPVDYKHRRSEVCPVRPERFEELVTIAEALSAGEDFLRVDLYALANRIVFGELTAYPVGGTGRFDPPEFDRILGETWTVPARYA